MKAELAPDPREEADLSILTSPPTGMIIMRLKVGDMNADLFMHPDAAEQIGVNLCKVADEMRAKSIAN